MVMKGNQSMVIQKYIGHRITKFYSMVRCAMSALGFRRKTRVASMKKTSLFLVFALGLYANATQEDSLAKFVQSKESASLCENQVCNFEHRVAFTVGSILFTQGFLPIGLLGLGLINPGTYRGYHKDSQEKSPNTEQNHDDELERNGEVQGRGNPLSFGHPQDNVKAVYNHETNASHEDRSRVFIATVLSEVRHLKANKQKSFLLEAPTSIVAIEVANMLKHCGWQAWVDDKKLLVVRRKVNYS